MSGHRGPGGPGGGHGGGPRGGRGGYGGPRPNFRGRPGGPPPPHYGYRRRSGCCLTAFLMPVLALFMGIGLAAVAGDKWKK